MAPPASASDFLRALRAEGLTVVEVGDWTDHNRNHVGAWGPVHGVMIHHTVTKGSARTVEICRKGYSGLPGPLCHGVITKDGRVHLVGYGRANHAGLGDDDVLRAVIAEQGLPADNEANTDGNRHFYGFECENLGDGEDPWPAVQLEAIERAAAAVCRHHGWDERSVIGHKEWQPGKVDPRGFSMNSMRGRVAERLQHPASWDRDSSPNYEEDDVALTAAEIDQIATAVAKKTLQIDGVIANPNPATAGENSHIALATSVRNIESVGRRTEAKVAALTEANNKLIDTVAQLAAGLGDLDPATIVTELRAAIEAIDVHITTDLPEA